MVDITCNIPSIESCILKIKQADIITLLRVIKISIIEIII